MNDTGSVAEGSAAGLSNSKARSKSSGPVHWWIRDFPARQREAISEAITTGSLAKVRRALRLIQELAVEQQGPPLTVELLSTYNLEPILPVLELGLKCLPTCPKVELAPLNDLEGHIVRSVPRRADEASARIVLWRIEEILPGVLFPLSSGFPEQLTAQVDEAISRAEGIVHLHQRHAPGTPLFLSTAPFPLHFANPVFAAQHSSGPLGAVERFNRHVRELAATHQSVYVLDVCAWAAALGKSYSDSLFDLMARQPLTPEGQMAFALFLARSLRPLIFPRRKVLAVDLDNTLWGGVVGEDGIAGLQLGHDFPGNVHLRIQRELLELRNRGALLVLLSKNNEADARLAFDSLPDMLLKWDDFAVRKVNWEHKHENLRAASRELGLGLDSFVFLDDSDYEREQMRQLIPEIQILNESGDALQILRALWETDAFDSLAISDEDRMRHRDYSVRAARDVQGHENDLQAFLESLEMEVAIEQVNPSNLERVATMLGKTNQFNLTTRRHSRAEVQQLASQPGSVALALRLRDKFGDQGIVAVLLAQSGQNGQASLTIDTFLVSCRALGRGVEDALWAALIARAREQKVQKLEAIYIPTPKNTIVAELYDRLGLRRVEGSSSGTRYVLEPVAPATWPAWISNKNGNE